MRVYLWVVFIIVGLMSVYLALVPITTQSDASKVTSNTGPF
jgi:hypothetical protein